MPETKARLEQLLVAPQGGWKYQKRLRRVMYEPVRLKDGRIVWGNPQTIDDKVNGGNLRSRSFRPWERSRYMDELTVDELLEAGFIREAIVRRCCES